MKMWGRGKEREGERKGGGRVRIYMEGEKERVCVYLHVMFICLLYRLLKIRCEKGKFQASSTCTKQVFQNVLDELNNCTPKNIGIHHAITMYAFN